MAFDSLEEVLLDHEEKCEAAITAFKRELQKVRTGRASSGLVEGLVVDYYGSKTPLNSLAQISTPEPRLIMIQAFDKGAIPAIEKAIMTSSLGLNPNTEGTVIRVVVPSLTEDSRKDLLKVLGKMAEDIRVSVRNHRRDANESIKKMEKSGDLTKDDLKRGQETVQKQTDAHVKGIADILTAKEAEVMEV
jgi:ribosome recycling factor